MTKLDPSRIVTLPLGMIERVQTIILALDPGKTTGYAYYIPWSGQVICGQLGPHPHHRELVDLIGELHAIGNGKLAIVYEQFEFRQNEEVIRTALRKYITKLKGGTVKSLRAIVDALEDIVEIWPGRDKLELISREYIGVILLAVQVHDGIRAYSHSASEAKSFIKDNKLTALGWYRLTQAMPHARDSLRHLLRHLVSTCNVGAPITTAWMGQKMTVVR